MVRRGLSVLAALAFCTVVGATVFAQNPTSGKAAQKKSTRAIVDKPVKDFTLKDLTKELKDNEKEEAAMVTLSKFKKKSAIALFFMSEKCGTTWRYEKRVGEMLKKFGEKDVAFYGVRCSAADTPDSIVKYAAAKHFDMPILNDAKGAMTSYFRVRSTPTFVLIDKEGILRYTGSFDDTAEEEQVSKTYLVDAIEAVMGTKTVSVKETAPFG